MPQKIKYVKQLTRENTLLERSLRTVAYHQSIREIGKASISKSPILGRGRITSLYYSPKDYETQQKIIMREFKGERIELMGKKMEKFLIEGYLWAKENKNKKMGREDFLKYLKGFFAHHAHSRGVLVYGYWGEPALTKKFKASLLKNNRVRENEIDHTISVLSAPRKINKPLDQLHKFSEKGLAEREKLIKKTALDVQEREMADILSWFTFFYEFGERVSFYLYQQMMEHMKKIIKDKKEMAVLEWYDPDSLVSYIKGKKLSSQELENRRRLYVLNIKNNRLDVLSGKRAEKFYEDNLKEEIGANDTREFTGNVASKGKVSGIVKIIVTQEEQIKMNKGDILVSPMTTPYLMSAVNLAAAIVTDEGGLTAHAAIVARELNIPCVIGTKIATQILKDGDIIEVDANNGIIKVIK